MHSASSFYKKNFGLLLILFATLILVSAHTCIKIAKGPHNVFFYDPEYAYLKNSLLLLEGKGAHYIPCPGTTIQIIGAATILILHKIIDGDTELAPSGSISLIMNKRRDGDMERVAPPGTIIAEFYITAINYTFFSFFIITYIFTAYVIFKFFHSYLLLFCFLISPYINLQQILFLTRVTADTPIPILCNLLILLCAYAAHEYKEKKHISDYLWLYAGLLTSVAFFTKILTLPVMIMTVLFASTKKSLYYYFLSLAMASAVFLCFIGDHVPQMFGWISGLIVHTGPYGTGEANFINPSSYFSSMADLLINNSILTITILFLAVSLFVYRNGDSLLKKAIMACLISFIIVILTVSKQYRDYYLMTIYTLIPMSIYLAFQTYSGQIKKLLVIIFSCLIMINSIYLSVLFFPGINDLRTGVEEVLKSRK